LLAAVPDGRFEFLVLADDDVEFADGPTRVVRCWKRGDSDVRGIIEAAGREGLEAVVFEFNWGYLNPGPMAAALDALHAAGVRTIVQFHATAGRSVGDRHETLGDIARELSAVDVLVAHSDADEAELLRVVPTARVVRTVLGQRPFPDEPIAEVRQALGISDRAPVVATFGFLIPHKGVVELIRSVPILARTNPGVCFLAVCAVIPTMRASVELRYECAVEVRRLGLEGRVALVHEFLPENVAMMLLHAADLIVLPYGGTRESASAAARFALSSSRPVATSDAPIFDALGDAVYRISDITPDGLARSIDQLIADEEQRSRLVAAARDLTAMSEWPKLGRDFANLLDSVFE